jgi:hypothetical protein
MRRGLSVSTRHKSIRPAVLATLAVVTLGLASLSLIAEPVVLGQEKPGQTNCAAESYAESLGISFEEAVRRLELQNEMSDLQRIVREKEPALSAISPQSSQPQPDSPLPPNVPALLDSEITENRWRWVEATDLGMSVLTSALPTVYVSFATGFDIYAPTELNLLSGHCFKWRYEVTGIPEAFTLSSAGFHRASCGDCVKAQFFWVKSVLERATSYTIEDDQLILHGEDAVIVLEMDNPSQKEAIGVMPHRVGIAHLDAGCPSEQQID